MGFSQLHTRGTYVWEPRFARSPETHTAPFGNERQTMRKALRLFLHNHAPSWFPISKFSTMQERFDDGDAFRAEYRSRNS